MGIENDTTLRKYEVTITWSDDRSTTGTIVSAGGIALAVARYTTELVEHGEMKSKTPKRVEWQVLG